MTYLSAAIAVLVALNYLLLLPDHMEVMHGKVRKFWKRLSEDLAFQEKCTRIVALFGSIVFLAPAIYAIGEAAHSLGIIA